MSAAFDPRSFKAWPIGPPRRYYPDRHYLLRFMEPKGAISTFDRSWYGRVLVERVEDLIARKRWKAGYREIIEFERMLTDDGIRIAKIFFHISAEEQLARFEEHMCNPMKRWKLTYEDFRNLTRWDDYTAAISDVVKRLVKDVDLSPRRPDDAVLAAASKHFENIDMLVQGLRGRTE